MSRLSMDLKVMSRPQKGHQYILWMIDEMTNYLITAPLYQARSEKVGEALIENVITKLVHQIIWWWIRIVHLCHP